MKRLAGVVALACSFCAIGCVDGKTPDCSTPASGCYPGDAGNAGDGGQSDASDASSDGGSEGGSDATAD